MTLASTPLLLTLSGVATLAKVERPTVSMWRSRAAASAEPFPEPVRTEPQHLFDGEQVTMWLSTTGRGNNSEAAADLAVVASLESSSGPEQMTVMHGLTALLTLAVSTGERLSTLSPSDVLNLADDADPHDVLLYSEIQALGAEVTTLARHAERMADAAYTPTEALESLIRRRAGNGAPLIRLTPVTPIAAELVARLTAALVAPDAVDSTTFVDPYACADVLVTLRGLLPENASPTVAVDLQSRTPDARLYRRRLVTHGWRLVPVDRDEDRRLVLPGDCVVVAVLPFATARSNEDQSALAMLDDLALALGAGDQVVVLGPVTPLVGRLSSASDRETRDALLRSDRVRTIARLPRGLVTGSPRQSVALWVLGAARDNTPVADRRTTVADLSATQLDAGSVEDLATDVVSAVADPRNARRHMFRFARSVPTRELLASTGDLVGTPRPRARRVTEVPAETALRLRELLDVVNGASPGELTVDADIQEGTTGGLVTLGELLVRRVTRMVSGHRLRAVDILNGPTAGGVTVIGIPELLGHSPLGTRTVDRLTFSTAYPAARYTEPGDVVFCTTPGIGARVDEEGLSVVQYPARILRLAPEARGLLPRLLARDIASAPAKTPWRTWPVRVVPVDQTAALDGVLDRIAAEHLRATERLTTLDALAALLADGVASGALTLNPTPIDADHSMNQEG